MNHAASKLPPIPVIVTTAAGMLLAVVFGVMAGSSQALELGAIFGSIAGVVLLLALGSKTWVLIPACWLLTGKVSVLPLPFSVQELGILAAISGYVLARVFKRPTMKPAINGVDVLIWVNLIYLASAFLRNPVGVRALDSELVGGKPYMSVALAFAAYWILSRTKISPQLARWMPLLVCGAALAVAAIGILTIYFPGLVPSIAPFYSGISVSEYMSEQTGRRSAGPSLGENRLTPLSTFGLYGMIYCLSRWKPSSLFSPSYPNRALLVGFLIIAVLLSGFRSTLAMIFGYWIIATFVVERPLNAIRTVTLAACMVFMVVALHSASLINLPRTAQRALCWLPGKWDESAVRAAKGSSEWRWEMWRLALTSDRYIKSKALGDGFGFSRRDLQIMLTESWGGAGFIGDSKNMEAFMVTGAYHSGPVTAIRFVGYVGLVLYATLLFAVAYYAWKVIKLTLGTPFQFPALFAGIPAIFDPVYYLFIFGDYRFALPATLFYVGMLKMVHVSYLAHTPAPRPAQAPEPAKAGLSGRIRRWFGVDPSRGARQAFAPIPPRLPGR